MKKAIRRIVLGQISRQRTKTSEHLNQILEEQKIVAIDIGAAHGLLEHWDRMEDAAIFHHVEPHPESAEELKKSFGRKTNHFIIESALSKDGGRRTLSMTNTPTGSSILPFNEEAILDYVDSDYLYPIRKVEIDTIRTSEAFDRAKIQHLDIIKLDVQGAEFEILQGLDDSRFSTLLCAEFEINFHNAYLGQGSFSEIQEFLESKGLKIYDLRLARAYGVLNGKSVDASHFGAYANSRSVSSRIWEADLVFFRDYKKVIASKDVPQIRRLIALFALYGYFIECLRVVAAARESGLFTLDQSRRLEETIFEMHRSLSMRWFDKPTLCSRTLRRIANFLHVGTDWYRLQYSHVSLPNS